MFQGSQAAPGSGQAGDESRIIIAHRMVGVDFSRGRGPAEAPKE